MNKRDNKALIPKVGGGQSFSRGGFDSLRNNEFEESDIGRGAMSISKRNKK